MSIFVAWTLYPLILLALCAGLGLLVDELTGRRLPGPLVVPVGLAAIVVVAEAMTLDGALAAPTAPIVCFGAVLGAGLALPWRFGRPDLWPAAAALAVFATFAAPIVLSGEPTFAGYGVFDDIATRLALADRVMDHGQDLGGAGSTAYFAALQASLRSGGPLGILLPFGTAQKLTGGDLAWLLQPYLSFLGATLSLCLWQVSGAVLGGRPARAAVALLAAQPALLYAYAMSGGLEQLGAAALIALAAALAPIALRAGAGPPAAAPLVLVGGALIGVLGLEGVTWMAPMLVAVTLLTGTGDGQRSVGRQLALVCIGSAVFATPAALAGGVVHSGPVGEGPLGPLLGPLDPFQALGIWPSGDFRTPPSASVASAVMIASAVLAGLLGLVLAWRRRALSLLCYAGALLGAVAVIVAGPPWSDAGAMAIASPVALALASAGAVASLRIDRLAGGVLIALLAGGVLWSNVLVYGGVDLAPYGRLAELARIGHEFAGQGPTLLMERDPYGTRHFLRFEAADGAWERRPQKALLRDGKVLRQGEEVDADRLDLDGLLAYRTLVLPRSPARSRPPSPYRLVRSGRYYEVWQRPFAPTSVIAAHQPYGANGSPAAVPPCAEVTGLALLGVQDRLSAPRLLAAGHAPAYWPTGSWLALPRSGTYEAWLRGPVRGAVSVYVDGRELGEARHQLGAGGGWLPLGRARLSAGRHRVAVRAGGADLHPGSAGSVTDLTGRLLFTAAGPQPGRLVAVPAAGARRLCGRPWDWIEAVGVR